MKYFPWRLFRWFVTQQILIAAVMFFALSGILLIFAETFGERVAVVLSTGLAFLSMVSISVIMARRLVIPLGRLIEKTRRISELPVATDEGEPEALVFDEPGEWYDLERALNRLARDLRNKTIRLSREKTELRAIMASVSEAVLAVSKSNQVMFFNPQFTYVFGVQPTSTDLTLGQVTRSPDITEAYHRVMTSGETLRCEVQEPIAGEKRLRHLQLSLAPLRKKHNQEIYGVVGIFLDISALKQTEQIRIDFVGNVSHELRTPITTISGYLQTMLNDLETGRHEHLKEFMGTVTRNVGRLKNLVEDLLDLSNLESGAELHIEDINLRELTEGVTSQINLSRHKFGVNYEIESMRGDLQRIEQVVRNLLENAIRYVPEGRRIDLSWKPGAKKGVRLIVKDDGQGIAPKHLNRLFERFYRIDESRARSDGGTGIGLSLVKHIVQRHGGQVHVNSVVGQGAEFICDFPNH
ncbi:MAG: ATP-binding protein [Bdellovibrionales bacterium]